jgi:hypothetical protein
LDCEEIRRKRIMNYEWGNYDRRWETGKETGKQEAGNRFWGF